MSEASVQHAPTSVPPRVAVVLGDPRGIGPEVTFGALRQRELRSPVTIVGPDRFEAEMPLGHDFEGVGSFDDGDEGAGRASVAALERAVQGALEGRFHALVTGPVHKPSLHAAGWTVPGQTELLQRLSGAARVGMLMAAERTRLGAPLRVLLATTHHALRDVPALVTKERFVTQTALLVASLRSDWRIAEPRVALCALNPHASDGGLFGDEEARVLAPAVAALRAAGHDVTGPLPADTVFSRALAGEFDAVVAPYHDVAMAAFKTVSFGTGVNVTLGLPFVRTSPDHGTAFDIAGSGTADPGSMAEALGLAERLAQARFDTYSTHV